MMIWDKIRGHARHVAWFRRAIQRGRLSHAYVFAGPSGIGKRLFARTLAQCLFCHRHANADLLACGECSACKQVAHGNHADLHEVARRPDRSEFTIDLIAGELERRGREGLCYDMSLLPMAADRKIAILDDVTLMNQEAANAFLKTLEEPQSKSLIILLADNLDALLPTIRSRCQTIRFDPLSPSDVADLLIENEMVTERSEAAALAELSNGSLTVASQLHLPALRGLRDALYHELANPKFNSLELSDRMTFGLDEIGGDAQTIRRNAGWLIRFGLEFFRSAALSLSDPSRPTVIPAATTFAQRLRPDSPEDFELIAKLFDRMAETERHIDANVAVPRCWDALCHDLGRELRIGCQTG